MKAPDVAYPLPSPDNNEVDMVGVFKEAPISLYKGNMRVDIGGLCKDETDFKVDTAAAFGLSRSFDKTNDDFGAIEPAYFEQHAANGIANSPGGIRNAGNRQFFDYAIRIEPKGNQAGEDDDNYLKIVAACKDDDDKICMKEIKYWGWTAPYPGLDPAFDEQYNMSDNDDGSVSKINQFLIRTEGEQVLFYYHTGALSTSPNPLDDSGWTIVLWFQDGLWIL